MPACALLAAGCGARLCPDGHSHAQVWVQAASRDAAGHAGGPADAGCNLWVNRAPARTEQGCCWLAINGWMAVVSTRAHRRRRPTDALVDGVLQLACGAVPRAAAPPAAQRLLHCGGVEGGVAPLHERRQEHVHPSKVPVSVELQRLIEGWLCRCGGMRAGRVLPCKVPER